LLIGYQDYLSLIFCIPDLDYCFFSACVSAFEAQGEVIAQADV
jgi:hypothetical protein